jgi:MoxR-like ATPase
MEEGQVTVEGETRPLPDPFFVIATQNPVSQAGTFPLPESQLDRFLMCIQLGYPDERAERELLEGVDRRSMIAQLDMAIDSNILGRLQAAVLKVKTSSSVLDYLQRIIAFTRTQGGFAYGLSPRGALALLRAAKAWAVVHKRLYLLPEDIQAVLPAVTDHRLGASAGGGAHSASQTILTRVPVLL